MNDIWLALDSRGLGGIESHVAELAAGLRAAGMLPRVLFLADHGPHPLRARLQRDGVAWEVLPKGGLRALWRRLRAGRPALLHTHGYKANSAWPAGGKTVRHSGGRELPCRRPARGAAGGL